MKDEEKIKYRLSYFRTSESVLLYWESLSEDILDNIPDNYYYNTRSVDLSSGEVYEKTYILVTPVKKFRKKETVISLSDCIDLGLDDF